MGIRTVSTVQTQVRGCHWNSVLLELIGTFEGQFLNLNSIITSSYLHLQTISINIYANLSITPIMN